MPPYAPSQSWSLQRRANLMWLHFQLQKSLDSMTEPVFRKAQPVGRFSGVMAHGPAEKLSPHAKTITNRKGPSRLQHVRNADSRRCAFWRRSRLRRFRPLPRPRRHRGAASNFPRKKAAWVHKDGALSLRWRTKLRQCEQDLCKYPAGHSQAQHTRDSCLLPRELALHRFPVQLLKGTIAALGLMTQIKIDACRTASGTKGQVAWRTHQSRNC